METWLESVYSDGSSEFVSNPCPKIGESVTVSLRMYADAPVKYVYLRSIPNGGELKIPMHRGVESLNAAAAATLLMWEMMRGE